MLLKVIFFIYTILGIYASIQDIKYREVDDIVHIIIIIISLPYISIDSILACLVGFAIFIIPNFIIEDSIGGADIKFMATTGLLIGVQKIIMATVLSMTIAIISTIISTKILKRKNRSIPLIPYLYISCMLVFAV